MGFFKSFLACLLAIFIGSIVSSFFTFIMIVGIISSFSGDAEPVTVKKSSILTIDMGREVVETETGSFWDNVDFNSMQVKSPIVLNQMVSAIKIAATDPNIEGIYIKSSMVTGMSSDAMYHVRSELEKFKESQKFIVAYGDGYTQGQYWLASVADKVVAYPEGYMEWSGMSMDVMFFKEALDKLGVKAEIFRHGKYKSAIEPYMLNAMSKENKEQMQQLAMSMWGNVVEDVAKSRNITEEQLQKIASQMMIADMRDAVELNLIDTLCSRSDMQEYLAGITQTDKPRLIDSKNYVNSYVSGTSNHNKETVAVLYAEGAIVDMGDGAEKQIVGNKLRSEIQKIAANDKIKAVVLRVNSPGGSVLASDIILNELKKLQKKKPLVVSMGQYAASGGYYVSAYADKIFASPMTLTGSIGVFGISFNVEKGAKEILGVSVDGVQTNENAGIGSPFRTMTPMQKAFIQKGVDSVYVNFVELVAEGRKMKYDEVDNIASGRVWTGKQALELNLVDKLGTINDAVAEAAIIADLKDYRVVRYPKVEEPDFFNMLSKAPSVMMDKLMPMSVEQAKLKTIQRIYSRKGVQASMSYSIETNLK